MARYLLDTNIIIAAMKGHAALRTRLECTTADSLILSPVVFGELLLGAEKSQHVERNHTRLAALINNLPIIALNADTSRTYGRIRAALEKQGTPIGANDTWIAAQALALGAVMVTDNTNEFTRVPGLVVENWLVS